MDMEVKVDMVGMEEVMDTKMLNDLLFDSLKLLFIVYVLFIVLGVILNYRLCQHVSIFL